MKNNIDTWADFWVELFRSLVILTAIGLFLTLAASSNARIQGENNRVVVGGVKCVNAIDGKITKGESR